MACQIEINSERQSENFAYRYQTFSLWPHPHLDPLLLAKSGLFFVGPLDLVKCFHCGVTLANFVIQENEFTKHIRQSPYCVVLRSMKIHTVRDAMNYDRVSNLNAAWSELESHHNALTSPAERFRLRSVNQKRDKKTNVFGFDNLKKELDDLIFDSSQSEFKQYQQLSRRMASYKTWPKSICQTPYELSEAGFFYTGQGDRVVCFCCGGTLHSWLPDDNPWGQHAIYYGSECKFLIFMKGEKFVCDTNKHLIDSKNLKDKSLELKKEIEKENEINKDVTFLCKICLDSRVEMVFIPCKHVSTCAACSVTLEKCPICRKIAKGIVKLFFC